MKKIISLLLTLVLVFSLSLSAGAALTTTDALNILKAAVGLIELTPEQAQKYGISGTPTTSDALTVLKTIVDGSPTSSGAVQVYSSPQIAELANQGNSEAQHFRTMSNNYIIVRNDYEFGHYGIVDDCGKEILWSFDANNNAIYSVTKYTFAGGNASTPEEQAQHWYNTHSGTFDVRIAENILYFIDNLAVKEHAITKSSVISGIETQNRINKEYGDGRVITFVASMP